MDKQNIQVAFDYLREKPERVLAGECETKFSKFVVDGRFTLYFDTRTHSVRVSDGYIAIFPKCPSATIKENNVFIDEGIEISRVQNTNLDTSQIPDGGYHIQVVNE